MKKLILEAKSTNSDWFDVSYVAVSFVDDLSTMTIRDLREKAVSFLQENSDYFGHVSVRAESRGVLLDFYRYDEFFEQNVDKVVDEIPEAVDTSCGKSTEIHSIKVMYGGSVYVTAGARHVDDVEVEATLFDGDVNHIELIET